MDVGPLTPAEFCALEKALVEGMVMRKKRHVEMGPVQTLKLQLLDYVAARSPETEAFGGTLAEAVLVVSGGVSTGPAQAVASDLQMDWDMACASPGFVAWLRRAASPKV
jgi:hypothetical protein